MFHDFSQVQALSQRHKEEKNNLVKRYRQQDGTGGSKNKDSNEEYTSCIDESIALQDLHKGIKPLKDLLEKSRKNLNSYNYMGGIDLSGSGI